jgi:hypothetical protein
VIPDESAVDQIFVRDRNSRNCDATVGSGLAIRACRLRWRKWIVKWWLRWFVIHIGEFLQFLQFVRK